MSVPSKTYYCDKCDYQSEDLCLMGDFYYRIGTLTIPLQRKLAWCNTCSRLPRPFPSTSGVTHTALHPG